MLRHLQRIYCAFAGHQYWLGRGSDRLFLKCSQCGRETAGIVVGAEDARPQTGWWKRHRGQASRLSHGSDPEVRYRT